jgi:uncharacterized GH25 family protein
MRARVVIFVAVVLALVALLFLFRANRTSEARQSVVVAEDVQSITAPKDPAVAAATVESAKPPVASEEQVATGVKGRFLELRVVVKGTTEGISGANVRVSTSERPSASAGDKYVVTGANGVASIPLPETDPAKFLLQIDRQGFAGWWSLWDAAKGEKIPAQHTVELERATLIGGFVVNESSRPIADVTVRIGRVWRGSETIDRGDQRQDLRSVSVKTDATGKWTDDHVPESLLEHIRIAFSHPDYAEVGKMVDAEIVPELRAQTWIATLRQGERVAGFVMDTNKNPLAGATVTFGVRFSSSRKQTTSDANGRYELKNITLDSIPRENIVVAMAKGYAPATQPLSNKTAQGELNFVLQSGSVIRGQVRNREGDPLKGARVNRDRDSILRDDGVDWSATTDEEGRFEWDGAPEKPQKFSFGASGYAMLRGKVLQPSAVEQVIVLERTRMLKGTARNAETGELIEKFSVMPALGRNGRLMSFSSSSERDFKGGVFEIGLDAAEYNVVRFRAPGFLMAILDIPAEGVSVDAKLAPSKRLEGVVLNATGFPVPRAEVAAIGSEMQGMVTLAKGRFAPGRVTTDHTNTDENGRFTLDLSSEAQEIVAVDPEGGFAEMNVEVFRRAQEMRLLPWGRLEGTLLSNGKPVEKQEVALHNLGARSGLNTDLTVFKATTDQNGRFTFEVVPPRELTLSRLIPVGDQSWRYGDKTNITVAPGGVTSFEFAVP